MCIIKIIAFSLIWLNFIERRYVDFLQVYIGFYELEQNFIAFAFTWNKKQFYFYFTSFSFLQGFYKQLLC